MQLSEFGTGKYALHPSGIRNLLTCPWRVVMNFLAEGDGESGQAADTGSACHKAVHAFHTGKGLAESIEVMTLGVKDYPKADLEDAAGMFLSYATDPRNRDAEVVLCESQIRFTIAPAPEDPTQAPIEVEGTVDQVRRKDGRFEQWDLKTSKLDGTELLYAHMYQAAAYCLGAAIKLGTPVHPGGLILPRKYRANVAASPVFWHFAWTWEDIERLLNPVRHAVAAVRSGRIHHMPGNYCTWCAARTPDVCLPKLKKFQLL